MFYEFALIGTTASGKSSFSIELAKEIEAVILSLDSLCLYKNIDIASAKPNKNELSIIKHFGINLTCRHARLSEVSIKVTQNSTGVKEVKKKARNETKAYIFPR